MRPIVKPSLLALTLRGDFLIVAQLFHVSRHHRGLADVVKVEPQHRLMPACCNRRQLGVHSLPVVNSLFRDDLIVADVGILELDRIGCVFLIVIPEHYACQRSDNLGRALQNNGLPRIGGLPDDTPLNETNSDPLVAKGKHANALSAGNFSWR